MIEEIQIENYKSIEKIVLPLGRINVFIGENGAGKSNILEVIALAGAAAAEKLDNEFLSSRGIRVTSPERMRPGFAGCDSTSAIEVSVKESNAEPVLFELNNDNSPYSKWSCTRKDSTNINLDFEGFQALFADYKNLQAPSKEEKEKIETALIGMLSSLQKFVASVTKETAGQKRKKSGKSTHRFKYEIDSDSFGDFFKHSIFRHSSLAKYLGKFVVYSPENSALRTLQREGQIEPLGINGEGIFRLLSVCEKSNPGIVTKIKSSLRLLGWFEDFRLKEESGSGILEVKDRYLDESTQYFDSIGTNEGFLFLLFYFLLFSSDLTPNFFAIDNIDASLNPKLCEKLVKELVGMAKANDKQAILTTHNPSVLDGLNLDDDDQRLFVISRGTTGKTRVKRIGKPLSDSQPHRLSDLFISGVLGGLPRTF